MSTRLIIFILSILLVIIQPVASQHLKFKSYTVEDGLSNNSIHKIVSDPSGALWIGTWDGLNFFDGHQFTVYKHITDDNKSLPGNSITDVFLDNQNQVWVQSTSTSLSLYLDNGQFENFYFDQGVSLLGWTNKKEFIVQSGEEKLVYSEKKFISCPFCAVIPENKDDLNNILLNYLPDLIIKDSYRDKRGNLWYATIKNGLFVLPYEVDRISFDLVHNYTVDAANPFSLKSNEIYTIHEDIFGNIWFGLKDGGISTVYKNSKEISFIYAHPSKYPKLPNETIRAITQDRKGKLWLGYYNSGIYYFSEESGNFELLEITAAKDNPDWNRVRSLHTDANGDVWAGTYGGIIRVESLADIHYYSKENTAYVENNRNYDFFEDKESKTLWISCWGGVSKFDLVKQSFEPFEGQEKLREFNIRKLIKAGDKLYAATELNGVVILDGIKTDHLNTGNGLLDNSVYSLYHDKETGYTWVGTLGGISVFDRENQNIVNITEKDGLLSQLVYGILPADNQVWVSTTKGIAAINKLDYQITVMHPEEGWQSAEFSEGSYYQNERGVMFFGGVKGLNYFHPNDMDLNFELPKLRVVPDAGSTGQGSDNSIAVRVTPITFAKNPANRVLYKLNPLEKEWNVLDRSHYIRYNSVSSGNYTLEIKNEQDYRSENTIELSFLIPLPFWKSPVFITFLIILLSLGTIFWRYKRGKYLRNLLERKIEERTSVIEEQKKALEVINRALDKRNQEVSDQKAKLLLLHNQQKNPDFEIGMFKNFVLDQFRTPLSEFKEALENDSLKSKEEKTRILSKLDRLIYSVKDWENLSLLDHLDQSENSLTILPKLFESLTNELSFQLNKRAILFQFEYSLTEDWVEIDVLRLKLFLQYLFREILKYLENGSRLFISAITEDGLILLQTETNSQTFIHNLDSIQNFSPYLKSAKKILNELEGEMSFDKNFDKIALKIKIPYHATKENHQLLHSGHWKHLDLKNQLSPSKFNIVILGKQFESHSLIKTIQNEKFNIILEEEVKMVVSVLKNAEIDALVIYNEKITQNIVELIEAIQFNNPNKVGIPIIYIYELIDYSFQEKLMDLGIETFIQLPSSNAFIFKKIESQLKIRRAYLEEKKIHSFMSEEEDSNHFSPNEKLVKEAMSIIKVQFTNPRFRIESLSQDLGISKMKCYRAFKEVLETSPSELIIQLRLQKAEKLLAKKKMNISEVGFECGFNDPKYFSKLFKKHYGISPKNFQ